MTKIIDWSKLKQSADDNFEFRENSRKFSKWIENTVGKGEIARYEQFLLFPQCFQKACFPGVSKGVIVWEWVNHTIPTFNDLEKRSFWKTLWEKETSIFSFPHNIFYSMKDRKHCYSNI